MRDDRLDAAWAAAEAVLPEGWLLGLVSRGGQYIAEAWEDDEAYASGDAAYEAYADTPSGAVHAVAERIGDALGRGPRIKARCGLVEKEHPG